MPSGRSRTLPASTSVPVCYLAESSSHPAKMLPELARRLVEEFSKPADIVLDPMCGAGTTLVEAAALGRYAVGVEREARWAELARTNAAHALSTEAAARVAVHLGDARILADVLPALAGRVGLVLTSPPYACEVGNPIKAHWGQGGGLCPNKSCNYSEDKANLGHARGSLSVGDGEGVRGP